MEIDGKKKSFKIFPSIRTLKRIKTLQLKNPAGHFPKVICHRKPPRSACMALQGMKAFPRAGTPNPRSFVA